MAKTRDVTPDDVGMAYFGLHHQVHRIFEQAMAEAGLTVARSKVLARLHDAGPINQAKLANLLGFAPRSVTETVDALERDGLLTRTSCPGDRRARILVLTPAGEEAYDTASAVRSKAMTQIFGSLTPAQRAEMVDLITSIRNIVTPGDDSNVQ